MVNRAARAGLLQVSTVELRTAEPVNEEAAENAKAIVGEMKIGLLCNSENRFLCLPMRILCAGGLHFVQRVLYCDSGSKHH